MSLWKLTSSQDLVKLMTVKYFSFVWGIDIWGGYEQRFCQLMANLCVCCFYCSDPSFSYCCCHCRPLSFTQLTFCGLPFCHLNTLGYPRIPFQRNRTDSLFLPDLHSQLKWIDTNDELYCGVLYCGVLSSVGKWVDRDIAEFLCFCRGTDEHSCQWFCMPAVWEKLQNVANEEGMA